MRLPSLEQSRSLRYATVFYMYVMQGVPAGFALTAVANRLAAAGVSPVVIGKFVALVGVPWTVQFFWGPIIDRFQGSPMGRRKPWVFFAQILAFVASLAVAFIHEPTQQIGALMVVFFVHSVFASVQDASVDAMAISVTRPEERARVNAYMRGGLLVGEGVGAAVLASIMSRSGFTAAAIVQSFVLLGFTVATFFVRERRGDALLPWGHRRRGAPATSTSAALPVAEPAAHPLAVAGERVTMRRILGTMFQGLLAAESLRLFGAILAVYCAASVFIRAFSTHVIQQLHWNDTSLSVLTGTWGVGAAAVAIVLTGAIAERVGARRLLMGVIAIIGIYLVAF
ncbi:MAG: MFS transporter, partial [Candidatus Eremiobacteraeota bacterium]|nr:MFS transporter [Candidatus Eremiobacteraeota bacterium]